MDELMPFDYGVPDTYNPWSPPAGTPRFERPQKEVASGRATGEGVKQ